MLCSSSAAETWQIQMSVTQTDFDLRPRIERTPYFIQQNWISSPERYGESHIAKERQTLGLQCARVVIT
jgi:hypothetical protein